MDALTPPPERILLSAIYWTLSPKKRERIRDLIGETSVDNVVPLRSPISPTERNALIRGAHQICGER